MGGGEGEDEEVETPHCAVIRNRKIGKNPNHMKKPWAGNNAPEKLSRWYRQSDFIEEPASQVSSQNKKSKRGHLDRDKMVGHATCYGIGQLSTSLLATVLNGKAFHAA